MANRNWANGGKIYAMHVMPTLINAGITIGTTGAVASFSGSTTLSVTRSSTGIYVITLQPQTNFSQVYHASGAVQSPVSGLSGVLAVEIQNAPNTSIALSSATSGGVMTIKTLDAAGALVDPASGSVVTVIMYCSNSSVPA